MNVTIIGAGSWGCGLARILADNRNDVLMYDLNIENVNSINNEHRGLKLKNNILPNNVKASNDLDNALNFSKVIIICLPSSAIRNALKEINLKLDESKIFVNTSKGVEPDSLKLISQIVQEEIDSKFITGYVDLSGPTHAEEVIEQKLTLSSSASENEELSKLIQTLFSNDSYFRVYTSNDVVGTEICGAIKNVYAIASGMLEGLGYGDNAKAGLISRALMEIRQIVPMFGGKEHTIFGLAGVGDLIVTCFSKHSRNFQAGYKIALGNNLDDAVSSINMVVEGVRTTRSIYQACKKWGLNCPIIDAVYNVIYNQHDVKDEIFTLLRRRLTEDLK